jgi:cell division protein FtsB
MNGLDYAGEASCEKQLSDCRPKQMSPMEQLKATRTRKADEIKDLDEAIAALEKVPELDRVLHLLGKAMRY